MIELFNRIVLATKLVAIDATEVGLPKGVADDKTIAIILRLVFSVITLLTVIFIIITGLKLITMQGDPVAISKARQGLIYAALGMVIVMSADAIVFFVIGRL